MKNTKWLRSALLGGVAVSVMATGAQADELSDLKAQLEALQSQVNKIETAPAVNLPAGVSVLTIAKGQGSNANWGNEAASDAANYNTERGFTVSINPTADLPAPVTEITVYGYTKLDFSWANETQDTQQLTFRTDLAHGTNERNRFNLHAQQSRFGIKAKSDTAIGQIRTVIEGDFFGSPFSTTTSFRLRHAYGEWDFTNAWTLRAGQAWHLATLLPIGISTVDFTGPPGVASSRSPQLALKYGSGPLKATIGIGNPQLANADYPNLGGIFQYTSPAGHDLLAAFEIADWDDAATGSSGTGYSIGGGANIRLGDMITITGGGFFGQGSTGRYLQQSGFTNFDANGNPTRMWGGNIGVSASLSDAMTVNAAFGYVDQRESVGSTGGAGCAVAATGRNAGCVDDLMTIHANILWRPVKQMRLGWEVQWGRNDYYAAASNSQVRGAFGAWFFF